MMLQPSWEKVEGKWIIKKPPEEMYESEKGKKFSEYTQEHISLLF